MPTPTLSVIIPSRTQLLQKEFLTRAIESVLGQTQPACFKNPIIEIDITIALDANARPTPDLDQYHVNFVHSTGESQALAMNAGVTASKGDLIAFLEDDDTWHPERLAISLPHLDHCDFLSSTQLEIDSTGQVIRVNDFPTPSGWIMRRSTWDRVGPLNEQFRFHLDNEWLGRLADSTYCTRTHLVESTAPDQLEHCLQVRPWLANAIQNGGSYVKLKRHPLPTPLVTRLVHPSSGMARTQSDPESSARSRYENQLLLRRFHRIPW